MITPHDINERLSREPYMPLRLRLSNGDVADIDNPGLAFVDRLALYVFRTDRPKSHLLDDHRFIALQHIVQIEHIDNVAAKPV